MKFVGGILESAYWAVGQAVCPQNLVRTTHPTISVRFALVEVAEVFIGVVDVQDANFVKIL